MKTVYYPKKGLYLGGDKVLSDEDVSQWCREHKSKPSELEGLQLATPSAIRGGVTLIAEEQNLFKPRPSPLELTQQPTSFQASPPASPISRPSISNPVYIRRPVIPYGYTNPDLGFQNLRYDELVREIERARIRRRLDNFIKEEEDDLRRDLIKTEKKYRKKKKSSNKKKRKKRSSKKRR